MQNTNEKEFERLWNDIGSHGVMVLSTCADNRVTSRSMTVTVIGGKFYCQTNKDYLKCQQIAKNPSVALCFGRFTVEGVCKDIGKPCDNEFFVNELGKHYPDAARRWSSLPQECVLEITPTLIQAWIYDNDSPYIESWDMHTKTYMKQRQL